MAAKKKSRKGKGSYVTYANENRAQKNKQRKLDKHRKNHPNDKQAPAKASGHTRKKPILKGHYPDKKSYYYDGAGRKHLMPSYTPDRYNK